MKQEILPCPFCGGEAEILTAESMHGGNLYGVMCDCCACRTDVFDNEAEAIAAWNTRYHSAFEETVIKAWKEIKEYKERTCRIETLYGNQYCTRCGEMVGTWDIASELYVSGNMVEMWNYCPNCGAKVVE